QRHLTNHGVEAGTKHVDVFRINHKVARVINARSYPRQSGTDLVKTRANHWQACMQATEVQAKLRAVQLIRKITECKAKLPTIAGLLVIQTVPRNLRRFILVARAIGSSSIGGKKALDSWIALRRSNQTSVNNHVLRTFAR